jgi:glycosyltransferase involved in cell wall biosynthesis
VVTGGLHPSGREQIVPAVLTLIEHLAREHEVHAIAVRHLAAPATYSLRGATIHDLGRPEGRLRQWTALSGRLRRIGTFDVIHGYWVDPSGLLAAVAGWRFAAASVVTADSGEFVSLPAIDYGLQRSPRIRAVVSIATRLATRVHVATAFMQSLAAARGIQATRIPFGVDVSRIPFREDRPEGPPWRLLQVASLNRVKDQRTLLRALSVVRRTHDAHLDLVGEDTLDGAVQREAAALGLSGSVTFHGFIPNDVLDPFHRAAHVYAQSSLHEACGVSVLESAASGLPIVGTRVGVVSDWAGHAAVGGPPGDHEALAAAIIDMLNDRERRRGLARAARAWVEAHDANYTAREMTALYRSIVRNGR